MADRRRNTPPLQVSAGSSNTISYEPHKVSPFIIKATSSLLISLSTHLWMDRTLIGVMRRDSIQMAHLDPTEIISEPIPIENVSAFVRNSTITIISICCVGSILVEAKRTITTPGNYRELIMPVSLYRSLKIFLQSIVASALGIIFMGTILFFAAILCGASPWVDVTHSVLALVFVATLAFGPSFIFDANQYLGPSPMNQIKYLMRGPQKKMIETTGSGMICNNHKKQSISERIDSCALYGTFVGLIPISILRILDHGDQAQRWPFPMLMGATIGYSAGSLVGVLSSCVVLLQRKGRGKGG